MCGEMERLIPLISVKLDRGQDRSERKEAMRTGSGMLRNCRVAIIGCGSAIQLSEYIVMPLRQYALSRISF